MRVRFAYSKERPVESVKYKSQMYEMLAAGRFGNTTPQFFDLDLWEQSPDYRKYDWWGVRTLRPGGPCRLHCPREEVRTTAETPAFAAAGVNVSLMLDRVCRVTLWADVWDSPGGLVVYGIEYPPVGSSWRALMPTAGRHWEGTAARLLLRRHLNANSFDDLWELFDRWPEHVVEFSACDRCIGTVEHRNAVVWEVRNY